MQVLWNFIRSGMAAPLTLPPLGVVLDDLVDERDVSVAAALRLAHEVRIATLVGAEEDHVKHCLVVVR